MLDTYFFSTSLNNMCILFTFKFLKSNGCRSDASLRSVANNSATIKMKNEKRHSTFSFSFNQSTLLLVNSSTRQLVINL